MARSRALSWQPGVYASVILGIPADAIRCQKRRLKILLQPYAVAAICDFLIIFFHQ
jgi:hypothetical protein